VSVTYRLAVPYGNGYQPSRRPGSVQTKDEAMVQVRKLVLAIAAASALSSGMAQALQLGEMTSSRS